MVVELQREAMGNKGDVFAGLTRRLDELYERYDDDELGSFREFMLEVAERQRAATAELTDARASE